MLRKVVNRVLDGQQKRAVKAAFNKGKQRFIQTFLKYDANQLKKALLRTGVREGDTLLVHANFRPDSGFQGNPLGVVNAMAETVGDTGNLLMVSIPYRGSAYDYLSEGKVFNVRKTMSMMGLVTEMFRRRDGTLRSLHPTHPVLASGPDAGEIVAGHENCLHSCGPGSPFGKLHERKGKILFFDVSFGAVTFFHYVEDILKDRLPFPVYHERLFTVDVVDADGSERQVETYVHNPAVSRNAFKLEKEMLRQGKVRRGRVGNSRFLLVSAEDVVSCFEKLVDAGAYPYDL